MWKNIYNLSKITLLAVTLLLAAEGLARAAGDLISCRYVRTEGKTILLELDVASPVPHMIIVVQRIPPGVAIVKSSPEYKKFDETRSEAKWMLTELKPGKMEMAMTLDRTVQRGEVTGEIRYKNPITGHMVKMAITP